MSSPTSLYRFFDANHKLLYVGITHRIESRLGQHRKVKPWDQVVTVTVEHHPTREQALDAESAAIRSENPKWNVVHNSESLRRLDPRQIAQRMWPDAEWINGKGRRASVAKCRATTVQLCNSIDEAETAKAFIDRRGCGGQCCRDHEVVYLMR